MFSSIPAASGCVLISAFATLFGVPVGKNNDLCNNCTNYQENFEKEW